MPGTPHFPTLTNARPIVWFPAEQEYEWADVMDDYVSGHVATRGGHSRGRQILGWQAILDEADKDIVMGFWYDRKAKGNTPFYFDNPISNVLPPYDAPTLDESSGGALGARTYYVKTCWANADDSQETTPSQEDSKAVQAAYYLTVGVITFPSGADHARIYVGTATGLLYYSGRVGTSDATWTEDSASTTVNGQSNAGQKVLLVAATTGFQVGGVVRINSGGARQEDKIIASIQSGTSLTMTANLAYEHTAAQADAVATQIGLSTQAVVPTANTLEEELRVLFLNRPKMTRIRQSNMWAVDFRLVQAWA